MFSKRIRWMRNGTLTVIALLHMHLLPRLGWIESGSPRNILWLAQVGLLGNSLSWFDSQHPKAIHMCRSTNSRTDQPPTRDMLYPWTTNKIPGHLKTKRAKKLYVGIYTSQSLRPNGWKVFNFHCQNISLFRTQFKSLPWSINVNSQSLNPLWFGSSKWLWSECWGTVLILWRS